MFTEWGLNHIFIIFIYVVICEDTKNILTILLLQRDFWHDASGSASVAGREADENSCSDTDRLVSLVFGRALAK